MKRYIEKLKEEFTSVCFDVYENKDIDEQLIRDLIDLNRIRITSKKLKFGITEKAAKSMIKLAKLCGVVCVIQVDGRLCAGAISYRLGHDQLAVVIAHDPEYKSYRPGTLCYYLTICESITNGVKRFHMGGGRFDYKSRLLGVQKHMEELVIYRSYAHMALNCDWVAKTLIRAGLHRLKK